MDLISAVREAIESGSVEIKRNWWHNGMTVEAHMPLRVKKEDVNSQKPGYWNPTTDDILADDWTVIKK